jgi:gas vesicle protein
MIDFLWGVLTGGMVGAPLGFLLCAAFTVGREADHNGEH